MFRAQQSGPSGPKAGMNKQYLSNKDILGEGDGEVKGKE